MPPGGCGCFSPGTALLRAPLRSHVTRASDLPPGLCSLCWAIEQSPPSGWGLDAAGQAGRRARRRDRPGLARTGLWPTLTLGLPIPCRGRPGPRVWWVPSGTARLGRGQAGAQPAACTPPALPLPYPTHTHGVRPRGPVAWARGVGGRAQTSWHQGESSGVLEGRARAGPREGGGGLWWSMCGSSHLPALSDHGGTCPPGPRAWTHGPSGHPACRAGPCQPRGAGQQWLALAVGAAWPPGAPGKPAQAAASAGYVELNLPGPGGGSVGSMEHVVTG